MRISVNCKSSEFSEDLSRQSLWQWMIALLFYLLAENASLRRQVENPEQQSRQLCQETEVPESRLNQDSTNSNRPPSSDSPYKRKKTAVPKSPGRPGARKGHPGHRQQLPEPTQTHDIRPRPCECGCAEFRDLFPYYVHQETELPPIEMEVIHFVLHQGQCIRCGKLHKARSPKTMRAATVPA